MKAQGYCHFNEDGKNTSFSINLFETQLLIEQDPGARDLGHGAVVWDAAVVLAKYMEKNYKDYDVKTLARKTVLELGSGCGLGGIAFMMKGAKITCTDLECVTRRLTEKNVQAVYEKLLSSTDERTSEILIEPNVFPIDWTQNPICLKACKEAENDTKQIDRCASDEVGDSLTTELTKSVSIQDSISPPELLASATTNESKTVPNGSSSFDLLMKDAPYDYVLLTDCVFSKELAVPLVNSILCCCGPRTSVICCHEIRDEDANAAFIATLSRYFTLKRVPKNKLHERFCNDHIEILIAKPIRQKKKDVVISA